MSDLQPAFTPLATAGVSLTGLVERFCKITASTVSKATQAAQTVINKKKVPALSSLVALLVTLGVDFVLNVSATSDCPCFKVPRRDDNASEEEVERLPAAIRNGINFGALRILAPAGALFFLALVFNTNLWITASFCRRNCSWVSRRRHPLLKSDGKLLVSACQVIGKALCLAGFWVFVSLLRGKSFVCAVKNHSNCLPLTTREEDDYELVSRLLAICLALFACAAWFIFRLLGSCFEDAGVFEKATYREYASERTKLLQLQKKDLIEVLGRNETQVMLNKIDKNATIQERACEASACEFVNCDSVTQWKILGKINDEIQSLTFDPESSVKAKLHGEDDSRDHDVEADGNVATLGQPFAKDAVIDDTLEDTSVTFPNWLQDMNHFDS